MALEPPEELRIDWSTAEVRARTLSVRLAGPTPKGLAKRFDGVRRLLEHNDGRWGAISVRKRAITVEEVVAGAEADLRHFLESVVLQIDSDLRPDPPEERPADDGQRADQQMASRFQAFAEADDDTALREGSARAGRYGPSASRPA